MSGYSQLSHRDTAKLVAADVLAHMGRPSNSLEVNAKDKYCDRDTSSECSDMDISDDEGDREGEEKKSDEVVVKVKALSADALARKYLQNYLRDSPEPELEASPSQPFTRCNILLPDYASSVSSTSSRSRPQTPCRDSQARVSGPSSSPDTNTDATDSRPHSSTASSNTSAGSSASDADVFVCGVQGCTELLRRDFFTVRSHIRYAEKHLNRYIYKLPAYPCPFEDCNFKNESMMRVAEHVCSDKHFHAMIHCPKCNKAIHGRLSSFRRHAIIACKCCQGCGVSFKTSSQRRKHEETCVDAQAEASISPSKRLATEAPARRRCKRRRPNDPEEVKADNHV